MLKRNDFSIHTYFVILMVIIITIIVCFVNSKPTSESSLINEVLQFLQTNGRKYLTFASLDLEQLKVKEILQKTFT